MDCSPPGSSVHGMSQRGILEWIAISFSRGSSWPRDRIHFFCVSFTGRQMLYHWGTREAHYYTLCPFNSVLSIHGLCHQEFFSLSPQNLQSYKSKSTGKEEVLSGLQISYLSHLDICQLNNPQPRLGEELLGCDTVCGLEFKETAAKEV